MDFTRKIGLNLPAGNEKFNIEHHNNNMKKLDSRVGNVMFVDAESIRYDEDEYLAEAIIVNEKLPRVIVVTDSKGTTFPLNGEHVMTIKFDVGDYLANLASIPINNGTSFYILNLSGMKDVKINGLPISYGDYNDFINEGIPQPTEYYPPDLEDEYTRHRRIDPGTCVEYVWWNGYCFYTDGHIRKMYPQNIEEYHLSEILHSLIFGAEQAGNKGAPGGYPELDEDGFIPKRQIPIELLSKILGIDNLKKLATLIPLEDSDDSYTIGFEDRIVASIINTSGEFEAVDSEYAYCAHYTGLGAYVGKELRVSGACRQTAPLYVFKDIDGNVLDMSWGNGEEEFTAVENYPVIVPKDAEEIYVNQLCEFGFTPCVVEPIKKIAIGEDNLSDEVSKKLAKIAELKADVNELNGIETPEIALIEGYYYATTSRVSSASWAVTPPILINVGDIIHWSTNAKVTNSANIPALVKMASADAERPSSSLVDGIAGYTDYEYTAAEDIYVAFSVKLADGYECKIERATKSKLEAQVVANTEDIAELKASMAKAELDVEYNVGYLQRSTGNPTATTSATAQYTSLFTLKKGETIEFTARGYSSGTVAVLYEYTPEGTKLRCLKAPESNDYTTYTYTETKEVGYYKASSYNAVVQEFKIVKYVSSEKANEVANSTNAESHDYLKLLFEKAIFIGDSLTKGCMGTDGQYYTRANYPYYIGKLTGWEITNAGHGGITTVGFWDTDVKTLDFTDKDICFIYLGQNGGFTDTLADDTTITEGQTYEDYAATNTGSYCKIIEYIKEQNPDIHIFILVGGGTNATTVLPQIAEKYSLPCLDIYRNKYFVYGNSLLYHPYKEDGQSRDGVHLGRIGYLDLAKSVLNMTFDYINEHKLDYEYPYPV